MKIALTIAGSDPSGGAGIQGDLKTFAAHGVYGAAAITALTVQNTLGVSRVVAVDADLVRDQIDAVLSDLGAAAVKIGMLANANIVFAVGQALRNHRASNIVSDVVMAASSGRTLLDPSGVEAFRRELLRFSTVLTPNAMEAAALTGLHVTTIDEARAAATRIVELGARAVVVKGGHLGGRESIDIFFDGRQTIDLRADRIESRHTHGTGCAFSSAIAARLALGDDLVSAVRAAKVYVTRAIADAPGIGAGRGPLRHGVRS